MSATAKATPSLAREPATQRLQRDTLQEQLYQQLRIALLRGQYAPGQAMTIRAIAELFETSTMPVREALRRLVSEGALDGPPNRTIRVPLLSTARLKELCLIRHSLEPLATKLAADKLTGADLRILDEACDGMENAIARRDASDYLAHHHTFHFTIYQKANSPALLAIVESLWLQLGPYLQSLFDKRGAARSPERHHRAILLSLKKRDASEASKLIAEDTQSAIASLTGR
ncbi:MAG: GntR family transcriptional regulator [Pseudomonadota bacterium]